MITLETTENTAGLREVHAIGFERYTLVCGHYGTGKTNLAINLARDLARLQPQGSEALLLDLDVVNPYFRSSDHAAELQQQGVRVIMPADAGMTVESTSISPEVYAAFDSTAPSILDLGGDDVGATAMGSLSSRLLETCDTYEMLYVVNKYRNLTATPEEACELLYEIEHASHLKATGVVNNSHLMELTTEEDILNSDEFALETARLLGLPLVMSTVPRRLMQSEKMGNRYPVERYVRSPWETKEEM